MPSAPMILPRTLSAGHAWLSKGTVAGLTLESLVSLNTALAGRAFHRQVDRAPPRAPLGTVVPDGTVI
jgi:hypothetical protein